LICLGDLAVNRFDMSGIDVSPAAPASPLGEVRSALISLAIDWHMRVAPRAMAAVEIAIHNTIKTSASGP
jgi:hypothetical protein